MPLIAVQHWPMSDPTCRYCGHHKRDHFARGHFTGTPGCRTCTYRGPVGQCPGYRPPKAALMFVGEQPE